MRDAARSQYGVSRSQVQPLLAYLEDHLPLDNVEPFLLVQVKVQRRPTRQKMCVLHDEEAAGRPAGRHFEENGAEP